MDMLARNLEQELLDAFNQFGKSVTVSVRQSHDNKLHVKMYDSSRHLMDMAACSLKQTVPESCVMFYPIWPKEDVVKQGRKGNLPKSGVSLRISIEPDSIERVNAARTLTKKALIQCLGAKRAACKVG